jgi:hypothetical protein
MRETDCDIAEACRRLHQEYDGRAPSYSMVWSFVASGRVEAERVGRRWVIRGEDLPKVAAYFKLKRKPSPDLSA